MTAEQRTASDPTKVSSGELACSVWPLLDAIGLGADQLAWRRAELGGSDADMILSGDVERSLRLWRRKRGEAEGEDLSEVLQVMLGSRTEAFNRQ